MSELKVEAVNHFQLHFFALNLGLIDMFLTNRNAEIVACMLLVALFNTATFYSNYITYFPSTLTGESKCFDPIQTLEVRAIEAIWYGTSLPRFLTF